MARILVVEDEQDFRSLLCHYLRKVGHQCVEAGDGPAALQAAEKAAAKRPFSLFIVDGWYLPGMRGTDLCRKLKGDPRFADVPLLVMSVTDEKTIRERLQGIEMARFISKPAAMPDVVATVKEILG